MKRSSDPRHLKRKTIMDDLFAYSFNSLSEIHTTEGRQIIEDLSRIDEWVTRAAPNWPLSQINKIDLAILRLSVYELMIDKSQPYKVVIDEAVELAKEFGADSSASLVNGALGRLVKDEKINESNSKGGV